MPDAKNESASVRQIRLHDLRSFQKHHVQERNHLGFGRSCCAGHGRRDARVCGSSGARAAPVLVPRPAPLPARRRPGAEPGQCRARTVSRNSQLGHHSGCGRSRWRHLPGVPDASRTQVQAAMAAGRVPRSGVPARRSTPAQRAAAAPRGPQPDAQRKHRAITASRSPIPPPAAVVPAAAALPSALRVARTSARCSTRPRSSRRTCEVREPARLKFGRRPSPAAGGRGGRRRRAATGSVEAVALVSEKNVQLRQCRTSTPASRRHLRRAARYPRASARGPRRVVVLAGVIAVAY